MCIHISTTSSQVPMGALVEYTYTLSVSIESNRKPQTHNVRSLSYRHSFDRLCRGENHGSQCSLYTRKPLERKPIVVVAQLQSTHQPQNVKRKRAYPRNAKSFSASNLSTPTGSIGTSAYSSVGKYDVSVIDCSIGGRGACSKRSVSQSTPSKKACALICSTVSR